MCFGDKNGSVSIIAPAGIPEYFMGSEISTSGNFYGLSSGEYILGFYDNHKCLYQDTINLIDPPEISLRYRDTIIIKDRIPERISLIDQNNNIEKIVLVPDAGSRQIGHWQFELNPGHGGLYKIIATDTNGCSKEYSLTIILDLDYRIFPPNAFSPNDDGINDLWNISLGSGYEGISLGIFDRWGNKVYNMAKSEIGLNMTGWNGKVNEIRCSPGVYIFRLTVKDDTNHFKNIAGEIHLIR